MPAPSLQTRLDGKRVFITGGTGMFGKWLLTELCELDVEIVLLSRDPDAFKKAFPMSIAPNISFIQGDVRTCDFPEGAFDYVIHAATPVVSDDLSETDDEMMSIIVDGTRRVIEFAASAHVERALYVSSGAVYGIQPSALERIPENHPPSPVTAYGKGKLEAERLCGSSDVKWAIARCFAFAGPHMPTDKHFAIGNFIGDCLRGDPIQINGDGTSLRSYMHATDLVRWLLTILLEGEKGSPYNVGSDEAVSIVELARAVRAATDTKNEILIKELADPKAAPSRYVPDIGRAISQLGLDLTVPLSECLRRVVRELAADF